MRYRWFLIIALIVTTTVAVGSFALFFKSRPLRSSAEDLPNIIILTLSGVRSQDSIDDPKHRYMPNFFNKIAGEGTLYKNVQDKNLQFHMTTAQAINTGYTYRALSRLTSPSIFQYIRERYQLTKEKVWSVGHWAEMYAVCVGYKDKEDVDPESIFIRGGLTMSKDTKKLLNKEELNLLKAFAGIVRRKITVWGFWDADGMVAFNIFQKVLKLYKPKFVHYILGSPESAHYGTYARYAISLKRSDEEIYEIWNYIRTNPFYKDKTYFIVSPDHNRDGYYMEHRSYSGIPSWLFIYGPDVPKGIIRDEPIQHVDLFATVVDLYDLKVPPHEGTTLLE